MRVIREQLDSLPSGYRTILSLYLFEGYDFDEIAQITDLQPSTVEASTAGAAEIAGRNSRIMDKLRTFIQDNKEALSRSAARRT